MKGRRAGKCNSPDHNAGHIQIHALSWQHQIEINEGIEKLYRWYLKN